ncbi:MAG: hypothetical protein Q7U23_01020 [Methylococcales bacterium]|jgi:hypothetical protein|nr:hypothetical protein [Methylococcales bacterium]
MSTIPFDTHAFYVELVESGLAEKTADALTKAVTKIELAKLEELATKRDISEMKADLQRWTVTVVMGTAILQTTIIAALMLKLTAHI